jgi:hypothetical protein
MTVTTWTGERLHLDDALDALLRCGLTTQEAFDQLTDSNSWRD